MDSVCHFWTSPHTLPSLLPSAYQRHYTGSNHDQTSEGLNFRSTYSCLPRIKTMNSKASRALNILKILVHRSKGCIRKVLLPLYLALIRSILDYFPPCLKLLDPIKNSSLLITIGAFRISTTVSLCAEAEIPPLYFHRLALTSGEFLATTSSHPYPHPPPFWNLSRLPLYASPSIHSKSRISKFRFHCIVSPTPSSFSGFSLPSP